MKKFIAAVAAGLMATCVAAADGTTADRHAAKGVKCEMCHISAEKTTPVRKEACLKCHGSYEQLAKRTAKVEPNPHDNHFGDRDCSTCHKGHTKSVVTCNQCHKFDLKTP
ncbi:MAG: cytochrome c3 family protein [Sutterellaceae bacterium]|nr:cytochrome c3 family protein [Sutterellaceae bacterium]